MILEDSWPGASHFISPQKTVNNASPAGLLEELYAIVWVKQLTEPYTCWLPSYIDNIFTSFPIKIHPRLIFCHLYKFFLSMLLRESLPTWRFSVQFSSVTQSCPTLCDSMNRSTPGLPVHHNLPEFTQIHIHQVGDAIQPSHPLSSPFPPAPNPSQHQSLFQ